MNEIKAQEFIEQNTDKNLETVISHGSLRLREHDKLIGELIIQDYSELEEINLTNYELTSLTVINCPKLTHINVRNNKLTKLELQKVNIDSEDKPIANEITEIIAGGNELITLDLICCEKLSKLMVADNSALNKLKNLNLNNIKNINITNTSISLSEDYEELKKKNARLLKLAKAVQKNKLTLIEPIQTVKQAEEAIQRHLKETEQSWREYFEADEITQEQKTLLHLSFKDSELNWKGREILTLIVEAQVNKNYQDLLINWQGGSEYQATYDFDGSLGNYSELCQTYQLLLTKEKIRTK